MDDENELGRYESKRRLAGHYRSATCVSYGRLELVSGHEDGEREEKCVPTRVCTEIAELCKRVFQQLLYSERLRYGPVRRLS